MSELIKKHKNISVFICFSIVALSFAFAAYFAIQMFEGEKGGKWFGLVYGVPTVLLTLFIHLIGNRIRFFHIVSLLMNAVASGLCVSYYYMVKEISVDIYELLVGCLLAVCVILLMWVLGKIRCLSANVPPTTAAILCCILMALAILMWIFDGSVFFSFGFFSFTYCCFLYNSGYGYRGQGQRRAEGYIYNELWCVCVGSRCCDRSRFGRRFSLGR